MTLSLSHPLDSPWAAAQSEPYPGRWTCRIVVGEMEEIDEGLLSWAREARDFALAKRRLR